MRRLSTHRVDLGLLFVVCVWGFSPVVFKVILASLDPLAFVFIRFVLLCVVAVVVLAWRGAHGGRAWRVTRGDVPWLIVSGLSGYGIYQLFYMEGLAHTTVFSSVLLNATVPLWTAGLLVVSRSERIARVQWLGIALSLAGVVEFLLAARTHQSELPSDAALSGVSILVGDLLTLAAAALFAGYGVVNARLSRHYAPPELMCYTLIVGTAALAPFGVPALVRQDWARVPGVVWLLMPYTVLFPIYITYSIWNWAIGRRGAGYVTLFSYIVPIVGGVAGWIFLGEPLTPPQAVGGALVLGGMLLARSAVRRARRPGSAADARIAPAAAAAASPAAPPDAPAPAHATP